MALISLKDVAVDFPVHNSDSRSAQLHVFSAVGGRIAEHKRTLVVRGLNGLTLDICDGDRVGIIGHNGSGKTTLLRVLAGVYQPTHGTVSVTGRASSFTDLTLGMDQEATGIENIIFRLVFMGLTFKAARSLSPAIEEFCELGDYLNMPVRTYSTGMFLRLAFAISTSVCPEIVIMDEMIGAGDAKFIAKAQARLTGLMDKVNILVLATHDAAIMQSLCNRVVWLHHGEIRKVGKFEDIYPEYLQSDN